MAGYGFSEPNTTAGIAHHGPRLERLMSARHTRYVAQGVDWGRSSRTDWRAGASELLGIHTTCRHLSTDIDGAPFQGARAVGSPTLRRSLTNVCSRLSKGNRLLFQIGLGRRRYTDRDSPVGLAVIPEHERQL